MNYLWKTEKNLNAMKKPGNINFNEVIDYNLVQKRLILEKKLRKESELVKNDSLAVLKEFEGLGIEDNRS